MPDMGELKRHLLSSRQVRYPHKMLLCECGCGLVLQQGDKVDMHEGIVTRRDVVGFPREIRDRIFCKYNVFLLLHDHHLSAMLPSRDFYYYLSSRRYGKSAVDTWLASVYGEVPARFETAEAASEGWVRRVDMLLGREGGGVTHLGFRGGRLWLSME